MNPGQYSRNIMNPGSYLFGVHPGKVSGPLGADVANKSRRRISGSACSGNSIHRLALRPKRWANIPIMGCHRGRPMLKDGYIEEITHRREEIGLQSVSWLGYSMCSLNLNRRPGRDLDCAASEFTMLHDVIAYV